MRNKFLLLAAFSFAWAFFATRAIADPPAPSGVTAATHASPSWSEGGRWGWVVLGTGVVVGGALTTYGLTFDCADANSGCQRRASIAIWGGIGIAALASAIGLAIVEVGEMRVQVYPTVSFDAATRAPGVVACASF